MNPLLLPIAGLVLVVAQFIFGKSPQHQDWGPHECEVHYDAAMWFLIAAATSFDQQLTHSRGEGALEASVALDLHPMGWWPLGADCMLTSSLKGGSQFSDYSAFKYPFSPFSSPKLFQRLELLNYTNANGDELVGLVVELAEDLSGGVQVRVSSDSNVVSCVSVDSLKECAVAASQQCDCCD